MTEQAQHAYAQWQEEWPNLDLFPLSLIGHLGDVAQRIERDYLNPFFSQFDLRPGEFDVLATLQRAGPPYALTPTYLYDALMTSSGGMTNRIDRLESAGLVQRQNNPNDRRGTLVKLTEKGSQRIEKLLPLHVENQRQLIAALSETEQQQLNQLLLKLAGGLCKQP
ncbi:MarR family winged helix-turn-helix transcriptional regulator [Samsonia erythrinae]|uniref:MarR family transcriptional regulator n=1 Tax=Samsonia erythrinae TaxID=160434 RepID=A0A4R3VTU7_9GAMM|nr:MarR family transcriptional regulator [Samsonia erythrinae]TCV09331.1 MarR family transcriptional regulator [Samsonia erythrinae]